MPLWKDAVGGQPSWLLGEDGGVGLGNNGVKNDKDINGGDLVDGNEIARADDQAGIGWRVWHSKENDKKIGEGRGWWEILATQDVDGGHVDMGGPVLGVVTVPSLTGEVTTDVTIQLSATDPDGSAVTYAATATVGGGLTGIAVDESTGLVTITPTQLDGAPTAVGDANSTHVFTWTATAGGVTTTSGDVTITVTAPV